MCRECWQQSVDEEAWCDGCVALLAEPTPVTLYIATAVVAAGLLGLVAFRVAGDRHIALIGWAIGAAVVGAATWRIHRKAEASRKGRSVIAAPVAAKDAAGSAYRGYLRRLVRKVSPPISGAAAAIMMVLLLAVTAGVIPTLLRLPGWVEWELTIGAWWAFWTATYTTVLFRGWRVARDAPGVEAGLRGKGCNVDVPSLDGCNVADGCADAEGFLVAIGLLVVAALALALAWVLVELVLPVVFIAAYWLVVRGLARVANDHHGCEGKLALSLGWGAVWALLYTAPLGLFVWLGHLVLAS